MYAQQLGFEIQESDTICWSNATFSCPLMILLSGPENLHGPFLVLWHGTGRCGGWTVSHGPGSLSQAVS